MKKYLNQIILGVIYLAVYFPTLIWMWDRWFAKDSYYSHGILIPFVTMFLIYQRREQLREIEIKPSRAGMVLIVTGVLVHLVSAVFRVYFSSGFSMLIVLTGLILQFYGTRMLKKIAFPLVFLFFMVPLPQVVIVNISFRMKLFAAGIAVKILNDMGLRAVQQGSMIIMEHAQVIVDDICSGLRSLISLTALGSIFAYWLKGPVWKKLILFASTAPIAVVTNVCRVVILASISEIWGPEHVEGFVHDATGMMVFALAFIMLYGVGKLIEDEPL